MGKGVLLVILLSAGNFLQAATIGWSSENSIAQKNDVFTLDIIGTGFTNNVDGGGVNFTFDSNVLNVLSVAINESVWDFGGFGINTEIVDNNSGTVDGIMVNAVSNVTGDFTIASIEFQAIGNGGLSSALGLSEFTSNPCASGGSLISPN